MAIKFAAEIAKEICERGNISIPDGYVVGEEFENWLYEEPVDIIVLEEQNIDDSKNIITLMNSGLLSAYAEDYGDAA